MILAADHGMNPVLKTDESILAYEGVVYGLDKDQFRFSINGTHTPFYVHNSTSTMNQS